MKEFRWGSSGEELGTTNPQTGYGACVAHNLMARFYRLLEIQNALQQSSQPFEGVNRETYEEEAMDFLTRLAEKLIGDSPNFEISHRRQFIRPADRRQQLS